MTLLEPWRALSLTAGRILLVVYRVHADVLLRQGYYALLEENCEFLKDVVGGGIGWFAHIYTDEMEPGYGIYDDEGNMKFPFAPRTHC